MQTQGIYQFIRGIKFFDSVPDATLQEISASLSLVALKGGDYLIKQGEKGDCMYILAYGRLFVTVKTSHPEEKRVGEIGVGDVVGEMALLSDMPRSASVRAVRDCVLIKIDRSIFEKLVKEHTQAAMGIVSSCVKRLMPNFNEKRHSVKTLCVMPCDDACDIRAFAIRLSDALRRYIKIRVIFEDDQEVLELMSKGTGSVYSWISNSEKQHDLLIFVTGHKLNEFTKLAVSQADKIIRVSTQRAELNQELVDYVNQSSSILAEKYLVITHPSDTKMPESTAVVLNEIPCVQHFHAAKPEDYQRIARFLLGRAISVVFSGGGLRGIAHQGLIRAFHERGIPIDMAAGTSFGSLPTVFCGMGFSPEETLEVWKKLVERIKKVVDLTLPVAAISKGEVLYNLLTDAIPPSIYMEDLWFPTFTVATNISNFTTTMINRGPAWEAVRASLSIPGIFPPFIENGQVLVDGASMNNLPVDLMGKINNEGTIIAAVASGKPGQGLYAGYTGGLSGWSLLFANRAEPKVPSILETMMSASLAASTYHQELMCAKADYTFDLGVDQYKLLDIEHWEEINETGYRNALKLIDHYGLTPEKLGV